MSVVPQIKTIRRSGRKRRVLLAPVRARYRGTVEAPSEKSSFSARSSNSLDLRHHRHLSDSKDTLPISPDSAGTFQLSRTRSPGTPLVDRDSPGKSPETTQIDRKCVLEVDYLSVAPRIITLRPRGDLRRPLRRGLPGAHFRVKIGPVRVRRVLKTGRCWHPRCPQYPY